MPDARSTFDALRPLLQSLSRASAQEVLRDAPIPTYRPGTFLAATTDGVASVQMDADPPGSPISAQILGIVPQVNDRVVVVFSPPHGAFVVGIRGGSLAASDSGDYRRFGPWSPTQILSSAAFITYPSTVSYSVTAPAGATLLLVESEITGLVTNNQRIQSQWRLNIGATTGASHTFDWQGSGNDPRYYVGFSEESPVVAGASVTVVQQARRSAGGARHEADTLTLIRHILRWR